MFLKTSASDLLNVGKGKPIFYMQIYMHFGTIVDIVDIL